MAEGGGRRAIGSLAILIYLAAFIVLAATIGGMFANAPWWALILFYAAAGIVWALPLKPLFKWMAGPPNKAG